jgi:uncharacterized protein
MLTNKAVSHETAFIIVNSLPKTRTVVPKERKTMKLIFISDIHGSEDYLKKALLGCDIEDSDRIVLLGDILYHGPRNPLPQGYNPKGVIELLNPLKSQIIAVRGNCDSEVDQMVLDFPMRGDYQQLFIDGKSFFLSHGHLTENECPKNLGKNTLYLQGHTHIPLIKKVDSGWHLNPGSISLPKENHPHTFAVYEDGLFTIKTLEYTTYMSMQLS